MFPASRDLFQADSPADPRCQPTHRSDSMWDTDYMAISFIGLKVSRTTIENLRWQLDGEIIQVTIGKSSTSLVRNLDRFSIVVLETF